MDDNIAQFVSITNASPALAESYLRVSDGDLAQAIQLFFDTGGASMDSAPETHTPQASARTQSPGERGGSNTNNNIIPIDESGDEEEDEDLRAALQASRQAAPSTRSATGGGSRAAGTPNRPIEVDDDEAMARRLQEEFYADASVLGETNGVRAPIGKTTETLVDPEEDMYLEHMRARLRGTSSSAGRPGIFNQRLPAGAVWGEAPTTARRRLAEATGGASEQSSKSQSLAEMYRPPYEIIQHLSFEDARDQAKEDKKWILINIQDSSIFDCQVLNRDIWKNKEVKDTIRENFLFLQYDRAGIDGQNYVRLYFPHAIEVPPTSPLNPFPIIAIVDPRTGEQVKVWTETPKKPLEFVMQLHEFLDRYSLLDNAKNPVQRTARPKIDVDHMTEEQMLELALQRSLNGAKEDKSHHDPDALTRVEVANQRKSDGKRKQVDMDDEDLMDLDDAVDVRVVQTPSAAQTPFDQISQSNHHVEPPSNAPGITRIQFKLADGSRVVRRFALSDKVARIYEYIKADLLPELAKRKGEEVTASTSAKQFELVIMGKNLIDQLDSTIEQAGLKMATVMIEFVDSE